ncbi:MAG TPA: hypothetical protein PK536_13375 [Ignavibacteria bacterium]|nr:hypothetical protein [Bacteroidota bacterium]HRI86428.1 hypothetical protein [Ignavibacteria bacterium]HRK00356.1 hypothetical protein [Ignavibacteria bacterium]
MKIRITVLSLFLLFSNLSSVFSIHPKFDLKLSNRTYLSSNSGFFDVILTHVNYEIPEFRYSSGKYVIILDGSFLPDHLNYTFAKDTATYGIVRIPPPNVGELIRSGDTLIIEPGINFPAGTEPVISDTSGTLVTRIKFYNPDLYSNSCLFEEQFVWKINSPGSVTEIYANISDSIIRLENSQNIFSTRDLCPDQHCCLSVPHIPPVRTFPLSNSLNNFYPFKFEWQKGFPVNYFACIQVAVDSLFSEIIIEDTLQRPDGVDPVKYFTSELEFETQYYWRVRQGGIPPAGEFNEPWIFRTGIPSLTVNLKVIPEGLSGKNNFYPYQLKVFLRNADSPYEIADSTITYLTDSEFQTDLYFMNAASGNYYLVIDNGNYLETWSKAGGSFFHPDQTNIYDFSLKASQAFGNNQIRINDAFCIYNGDLNSDGLVDIYDMSISDNAVFNFVKGESVTDLNSDHITDIEDYLIIDRNAADLICIHSPLEK